MSVLLAIDTSAGTSVALFRDRKLAAEINVVDNMKHAETIGTAIAQVLTEMCMRLWLVEGQRPSPACASALPPQSCLPKARGPGSREL
jgi:hypothetical protein